LYNLIYFMKWLVRLNFAGFILLLVAIFFILVCSFDSLYIKIRDLKKSLQGYEATNAINRNYVQFTNGSAQINSII